MSDPALIPRGASQLRSDLLGLTFADFCTWSRGLVGHAERFHAALYRQVSCEGRFDPGALPLWREAEASRPGTLATLRAAAVSDPLSAIATIAATRSAHDPGLGTTSKLQVRLHDGRHVEAVLIPMGKGSKGTSTSVDDETEVLRGEGTSRVPAGTALTTASPETATPPRWTVCVSSQVGCKMGCGFCHTATMGLVRQLTAPEIVAQVLLAARAGGTPRNVVFMGMGEPLDNADAVATAVRVLTDRRGLRLAPRHLTISTVGRLDGLARWHDLGLGQVNLAVSLGAADDALRSQLMPVNRTASLAELHAALRRFPVPAGRRILIGYTLIPGVNDSAALIDALIAWCADLPALVNLIPFNPIPSRPWRAPSEDELTAVRARLDHAGLAVRLRRTKGDAVMAACGQLGTPRAALRSPESRRPEVVPRTTAST